MPMGTCLRVYGQLSACFSIEVSTKAFLQYGPLYRHVCSMYMDMCVDMCMDMYIRLSHSTWHMCNHMSLH